MHSSKKQAFTLIELLVAMAVVAILMLVVSQIMRSAQIVTSSSHKHMDADEEARTLFDRMEGDLNRMVKRTDVDFLISKQSGNDSIFFFSESPSFTNATQSSGSTNSVALIGYQVNPTTYKLERLSLGLCYSGTSNNLVHLIYTNPPASTTTAPLPATTLTNAFSSDVSVSTPLTSSNYQVIAPDVFRMEVCFLLKPWTETGGSNHPCSYSVAPYNTNTSSATNSLGRGDGAGLLSAMQTSGAFSNWGEIGLADVQAIVVTIAILDSTSQKMLPNLTNALAAMTAALADPAGDSTDLQATPPVLPAQLWQNAGTVNIDNGTFATAAKIPRAVSSQVRIYQRVFPLN